MLPTKTFLIPFLLAPLACAQSYIDLGFEGAARGQFWYWPNTTSTQYQLAPDTTVFQSGGQSLRISSLSAATTTTFYSTNISFPAAVLKGHHVRISGWIKTDSVVGYADIWCSVNGPSGQLSFDNTPLAASRGTNDWKQLSFERDVSSAAANVFLGVSLTGTGTAWFDSLEVDIDGVPYNPGPGPHGGEPTQLELDWIRNTAIPVAGVDPALPLDDLAPLKALIGDARIVALGEDTHGTGEFFRLKHRIIQFLASQMGFTVFAIEANMPEAYAMNNYVLNGVGDPKEFLKGMYFWTWNTQEVLDMVHWMRDFNLSGQGQIQFTGFDMQTPDVAEKIVQSFVAEAEPGYTAQLNQVYAHVQLAQHGIGDIGLIRSPFPTQDAAGRHVHYTAYIKTEGITTGYAGLWWTVWGADGKALIADNGSARISKGTTNWTQYTIDLDVPENAASIAFGALHAGNGTAWFDAPAITLDGTPYFTSFDFTTFDMGDELQAGNFIVTTDPSVSRTSGPTVRSSYVGPAIPSNVTVAAETADVLTHMQAARDAYLSNGLVAADVDWAIQNARVVKQYADLQIFPSVRDPDMATNAEWILSQQPPGAKMVIWAHNGHVNRVTGLMGGYLASQYGDDYRVLGFAFHDGQYNAAGPQGLKPYDATPSFPGSDEYVMHQSGLAPFILDLRQVLPDDPGSSWLTGQMMSRSIGAVPADGFFLTTTLAHDFDALIFVDHSTPSTLLPF